jgi:hypothetical protein
MRYWRTKDDPTNANLTYLDSIAQTWPGMTVDEFMAKVRAVIGLREMLPKAVLRHFDLPFLYVGADPYRWGEDRLREKTTELVGALEIGLAAAFADPELGPDGAADWSDRPPTRGEEIKAALACYREDRDVRSLADLRQACAPTRLSRHVERLDKWLARKRPSSPHRSIEYEIADALGDIGRAAGDFHHEPASYRYTERVRAGSAS